MINLRGCEVILMMKEGKKKYDPVYRLVIRDDSYFIVYS